MTSAKVTIEPLDLYNFSVWRPRTKAFCIQQKCWAAIKPLPVLAAGATAEEAAAHAVALRAAQTASDAANEMAIACITLHVANHHLADCEAAVSARALWSLFETKFRTVDPARKHFLQNELSNLRLGPNEPMTLYVDRVTDLKNELFRCRNRKVRR